MIRVKRKHQKCSKLKEYNKLKACSKFKGLCLMLLIALLALTLAGCSQKSEAADAGSNEAVTEAGAESQQADSDTESEAAEAGDAGGATAGNGAAGNGAGTSEKAWPSALDDWGLPKFKDGDLALVSDQSAVNGMMVSGVTYSLNAANVKLEAYQTYAAALKEEGFVYNPDSVPMAFEVYEKPIKDGAIKITLSYSDENLTLIVHNTALEAARASGNAEPSGDSATGDQWPEAIAGIPAFKSGTHVETIALSDNMYTITFQGVKESDLAAYRKALVTAGFTKQEDAENEGYAKIETSKAYSIGFLLQGSTLQLVCAVGNM